MVINVKEFINYCEHLKEQSYTLFWMLICGIGFYLVSVYCDLFASITITHRVLKNVGIFLLVFIFLSSTASWYFKKSKSAKKRDDTFSYRECAKEMASASVWMIIVWIPSYFLGLYFGWREPEVITTVTLIKVESFLLASITFCAVFRCFLKKKEII